jgi:hypothetical protein
MRPLQTRGNSVPDTAHFRPREGAAEVCSHDENLERYREALNATADDKECRELFLTIVCILDQQRERRRLDPL